MLKLIRVVGSLLILAWGIGMLVLGIGAGVATWIGTGLVVAVIGLPLLAASPWCPEWRVLAGRLTARG